jgi:hypothetical protein
MSDLRALRAYAWSMSQLPGMPPAPLLKPLSEKPPRGFRPPEERSRHEAGDHSLCSPDRGRHGICSQCGKTVAITPTSAPPERRRCRDCQRAHPRRTSQDPRVCELCECEYIPKHPPHRDRPGQQSGQRFCSKSCKRAWQNGSRPPFDRHAVVGLPRKRRHDRIRRQRRAETWDGVTDAEILERDRWRCGICRKAIGKTFKWPHPKSASIDHIIPISEGGEDTAGNKRAAHLGCNCGRMNRGGGEQAALF